MLVPGPGGVNGTGMLGHITKAVGKDKLFFPDFSQSGNKTQGNRGLGSENASLLTWEPVADAPCWHSRGAPGAGE